MTESLTRRLPAGIPFVLVAVVGWLVFEAVARIAFALAGVVVLEPLVGGIRDAAVVGGFFALLVGLPVAAALLSRYVLYVSQVRADWDRRAVAAGLAAGLLGFGTVSVFQSPDAALFGANQAAGNALVGAIETALWAAVVLLLGNGVVGPAAEERVWQGVAQTEFVDRLGSPASSLRPSCSRSSTRSSTPRSAGCSR